MPTTPKKSPAKVHFATPPTPGTQFFYHTDKNKEHGETPEKKHTIPLPRYIGKHHINARKKGKKIIFQTPANKLHATFDDNLTQLKLNLKNLKERVDHDYQYEEINLNHLSAAKISANGCITILKNLYIQSKDKEKFMTNINSLITGHTKYYSPFEIKKIYSKAMKTGKTKGMKQADDLIQNPTLIKEESLQPPPQLDIKKPKRKLGPQKPVQPIRGLFDNLPLPKEAEYPKRKKLKKGI